MRIINHNKTTGSKARGFTLIELLVVIAIIILVAATALPTAIKLFSAGADAQAYNLFAAQLAYARSQAILKGTYVGVHVQVSDRADSEKDCYSAVVVWKDVDPALNVVDMKFALADNAKPRKIPGNMAFGQLTGNYFNASGNYDPDGLDDSGTHTLQSFTTFTIVFDSSGQVVRYIDDGVGGTGNIVFDDSAGNGLFGVGAPVTGTILWNTPDPEAGATAVTIFNCAEMGAITRGTPAATGNARRDYMNNNWGQIMALNIYTGRFFHRY
ncbi:MAG: prepilin-type N-terminal cleavage/methylation domain-containing protein [Phycisphaerae bacterium]|nr:prepilin-type N-terminal cleavage/methylation domain-containing protein [Phycisphaerae bacterium]